MSNKNNFFIITIFKLIEIKTIVFCIRKIRVKKIKNKNNFEDEPIPNLKWI